MVLLKALTIYNILLEKYSKVGLLISIDSEPLCLVTDVSHNRFNPYTIPGSYGLPTYTTQAINLTTLTAQLVPGTKNYMDHERNLLRQAIA